MYKPAFKGPIEGWTVNYTKPLFWRVESIMEWRDLLQEAYIVFMRCEARYPLLDTPQHFMSLYQRAWKNHLTDLSNEATRLRRFVSDTSELEDGEVIPHEGVGDLDCEGALSILLRQAPDEVRRVINLMLNAPQELLDIVLADWKGHDARRKDGGGRRINRALGFPDHVDVYRMVEDYFRS